MVVKELKPFSTFFFAEIFGCAIMSTFSASIGIHLLKIIWEI